MPSTIKTILMKKKVAGVVYGVHPETEATVVKYDASTTVADQIADFLRRLGPATVTVDNPENPGETISQAAPTVDAKIAAAVDAVEKRILGLDGANVNDTINTAYDTIREIAAWIESDGTGAASLTTTVASLNETVNGDPEDASDTGLVGAVSTIESDLNTPTTGLKARVTQAETDINTLESALGADDTSGVRLRVANLEGTVNGDPENASDTGLVGVVSTIDSDLNTATTGLKARVTALENASSAAVRVVASDYSDDDINATDLYFVELA